MAKRFSQVDSFVVLRGNYEWHCAICDKKNLTFPTHFIEKHGFTFSVSDRYQYKPRVMR